MAFVIGAIGGPMWLAMFDYVDQVKPKTADLIPSEIIKDILKLEGKGDLLKTDGL